MMEDDNANLNAPASAPAEPATAAPADAAPAEEAKPAEGGEAAA